MNLAETEYWIDRLFPSEMTVEELTAAVPGQDRGAPARLGPPFSVGTFRVGETETLCATLDHGRFDTGLRTPEGQEVRVEVFLTAASRHAVSDIVATAATIVAEAGGAVQPTPGTILEDAVTLAYEDLEAAAADPASPGADVGVTTPHLLLVVPYVWADGTPMVVERPGEVHRHDSEPAPAADAQSSPAADLPARGGRITTVAQLVGITDGELALAREAGVDALMSRLASSGADLRDLSRASTA